MFSVSNQEVKFVIDQIKKLRAHAQPLQKKIILHMDKLNAPWESIADHQ